MIVPKIFTERLECEVCYTLQIGRSGMCGWRIWGGLSWRWSTTQEVTHAKVDNQLADDNENLTHLKCYNHSYN